MIPAVTDMKKAFDLTGKTAVIVGGNGGIGSGIARAMAQSGADVVILDINNADDLTNELVVYGGKYRSYECDILDHESVRTAVSEVCDSFGSIDILVNSAGVTHRGKLLDMDQDLSAWRRVIDIDLTGIAQVVYEVGKRMRDAKKGGAIVNITSNSGFIVNKGIAVSPYAAAKAGANQFTRSMAAELGEFDIRVNAIAPGYTHAGLGADPPPFILKLIDEQQPLKRMAEASEIGALAVFLASPAATHITGSVIIIDGGYSLSC